MKYKTKVYIVGILIPLLCGALISFATSSEMKGFFSSVKLPPLTPPSWLFPTAWSILYALMGLGSARVFLSGCAAKAASLKLYFAQLFANLLWSIIFFMLRAFLPAFIWLIFLLVLIVLMLRSFYRCDVPSALLQIPYVLWVSFAGYLNLFIWILNR